jgi:hypothetical protein
MPAAATGTAVEAGFAVGAGDGDVAMRAIEGAPTAVCGDTGCRRGVSGTTAFVRAGGEAAAIGEGSIFGASATEAGATMRGAADDGVDVEVTDEGAVFGGVFASVGSTVDVFGDGAALIDAGAGVMNGVVVAPGGGADGDA